MNPQLANAVRITASQTIHDGPAAVSALFLSGDGAAADADIYDGVNTQAGKLFHIEAASGESQLIQLPVPALFHHGIHAVVNASTSNLTLVYQVISRINPGAILPRA